MTDTQKKAAVFDFDGTLIRGDSIVRFLRFAAARGALPRRELFIIALCALGGKMGLVPMEKVKERALRFERGLTRAEKEKLCLGFAERVLVPGLLPEGKKTWENLRREGCVMALASASTSDYMEPLSRALGADRLICTRVAEDGRVSKNCRGEEKARRVAEWAGECGVDLSRSEAFGDSAGDRFMMRLCGRAHAVNPGRRLKREAKERGWEILYWK